MALSPDEQRSLVNLLEQAEQRLDDYDAPIAIVGMSCRIADANSPKEYWELLRSQRDAVSEVPGDRWDVDALYDPDPNAPGKMATRWGGFLRGVDVSQFDASFFGIGPGEAQALDPQQRLLLECVWEAFEDAGMPMPALRGSRTGVYIGISSNDYAQICAARGPTFVDNPYIGTGLAPSAAAGRISYVFGFCGPSVAIDTACSSSLYALHAAVAALRNRDCDMAVVGGVNLLLAPAITAALSHAGLMAADGRCKTFDAAANGYVRGEGCGVVVLKRQADATGNKIRAMVRATAANQDGASGGLTVPSGPAQESLIADALARAALEPGDIDYLEAHGTGTQLGDPIEANALRNVFARDRDARRPLLVGSVKTNIGHLEAAAGMASLIKVVLALENEEIPAQLHLRQPNRKFAWKTSSMTVVSSAINWIRGPRKRVAGISAFAVQGSNAHTIIEEAPQRTASPEVSPRPYELLVLSANSEEAQTLNLRRWLEYLKTTNESIRDIAYTAAVHRTHFERRIALVVRDVADAGAQISECLQSVSARHSLSVDAPHLQRLGEEYVNDRCEIAEAEPFRAAGGEQVDIPTYAFARKRFWMDSASNSAPVSTKENASSLYKTVWRKVVLDTRKEIAPRVWIVSSESDKGARLREAFGAIGCEAEVRTVGDSLKLLASESTRLPERILYLPGRNAGGVYERAYAGACQLLSLVHALQKRPESVALTGLTENAQTVAEEVSVNAADAYVWGMLRVVSTEEPDRQIRLIDTDDLIACSAQVAAETTNDTGEDEVAYRQGWRFVARLEPCVRAALVSFACEKGSYVISGGLGAIGCSVAEWLAERGAKDIVLFGRGEPSETAAASVARMRQRGAHVEIARADVTDEGAVSAVIAASRQRATRIAAVFHAAGVLADATVKEQSAEKLSSVLRPKILGAEVLERLCADASLFLHFSSVAALFGNGGQANYAAANAILDASASVTGRRIVSIGWCAWTEAGMAAKRVEKRALGASLRNGITAEQGLALLEQVLCGQENEVKVLPYDWAYLDDATKMWLQQRPKFTDVLQQYGVKPAAETAAASEFWSALALVSPELRSEQLKRRLEQEVQAVLGSTGPVRADQPLMELGVDSLMFIELRNRVSGLSGLRLPMSFFMQNNTVAALTRALQETLPSSNALANGAASAGGPRPVVMLKRGAKALVAVHAISGSLNIYQQLASKPDFQFPIFGVEPIPHFLDRPLRELGREYAAFLDELKYRTLFIVGASWSGVIALEMARSLAERGGAPPCVIMIDSPRPDVLTDAQKTRSLVVMLEELEKSGLHEESSAFKKMAAEIKKESPYEPLPYSGPVHYLSCSEAGVFSNHQEDDWLSYMPGKFTVHKIRGEHHTFFRLAEPFDLIAKIVRES